MSNTLELLETIGRDASLRYASTGELASLLERAQASEALTAAVVSGDKTRLSVDFADWPSWPMDPPNISQAFWPLKEG
jgi:hypothetical protein